MRLGRKRNGVTAKPPHAADRLPHIVVVNQWRERYAHYDRYLDHSAHRVTYVSTEVGLGSLPEQAAAVALVEATGDLAQVRAALRGPVQRYGPPSGVVALKEGDLLVGARLRQEWGLPGPLPAALLPFRDKHRMCQAIAEAGLLVPPFAPVTDRGSVLDFGRRAGWPVVLKPRVGGSSDGDVVLTGPGDLDALPEPARPMLVQSFNPHPIYHVDGVFDGQRPSCLRVSRYVNNCLGFRDEGTFLGSVEEDDPHVNQAVEAAATGFLRALTGAPTPFHLEVFVERRPDGVRCTFLEVGARVGGAEIPFIWREVHGYDLIRAAFDLQLGRAAAVPEAPPGLDDVGGWLLVPAPATRPCRITQVTSMNSLRPGPYAQALLRPGEVLPAADAYYEHVGGRFRFRGAAGTEVEAALAATAARFRVHAEPVKPSEAARPLSVRIPEVTR